MKVPNQAIMNQIVKYHCTHYTVNDKNIKTTDSNIKINCIGQSSLLGIHNIYAYVLVKSRQCLNGANWTLQIHH